MHYVQCIVFPSPPGMEISSKLFTFCGVPGIDPYLVLQLVLHLSHAGGGLGVVVSPHSVFRRWTIFDKIVYDDWFSVVLGFFFIGCVSSISASAAFPDPLDELDGGDS